MLRRRWASPLKETWVRCGRRAGPLKERLLPGGERREQQVGEGLWAPRHRALTTGLVLTITFVASEALAVVTVMPVVARDLGGLRLYGWVFSGFMLGSEVLACNCQSSTVCQKPSQVCAR